MRAMAMVSYVVGEQIPQTVTLCDQSFTMLFVREFVTDKLVSLCTVLGMI